MVHEIRKDGTVIHLMDFHEEEVRISFNITCQNMLG